MNGNVVERVMGPETIRAATGIDGVTTAVVARRTREIGVRMALGARPATMLWLVLGRTSAQVAVGLVLGLGAAWLLATSVEAFLFEVAPRDVGLYTVASATLGAVGVAAAFFPARRASRVDPLVALRQE